MDPGDGSLDGEDTGVALSLGGLRAFDLEIGGGGVHNAVKWFATNDETCATFAPVSARMSRVMEYVMHNWRDNGGLWPCTGIWGTRGVKYGGYRGNTRELSSSRYTNVRRIFAVLTISVLVSNNGHPFLRNTEGVSEKVIQDPFARIFYKAVFPFTVIKNSILCFQSYKKKSGNWELSYNSVE